MGRVKYRPKDTTGYQRVTLSETHIEFLKWVLKTRTLTRYSRDVTMNILDDMLQRRTTSLDINRKELLNKFRDSFLDEFKKYKNGTK